MSPATCSVSGLPPLVLVPVPLVPVPLPLPVVPPVPLPVPPVTGGSAGAVKAGAAVALHRGFHCVGAGNGRPQPSVAAEGERVSWEHADDTVSAWSCVSD